jgi:hypothetical protein
VRSTFTSDVRHEIYVAYPAATRQQRQPHWRRIAGYSNPLSGAAVAAPRQKSALFLPDGFQQKDKGGYERMVRLVVARLSTRNRTQPYAAFTDRITAIAF